MKFFIHFVEREIILFTLGIWDSLFRVSLLVLFGSLHVRNLLFLGSELNPVSLEQRHLKSF